MNSVGGVLLCFLYIHVMCILTSAHIDGNAFGEEPSVFINEASSPSCSGGSS